MARIAAALVFAAILIVPHGQSFAQLRLGFPDYLGTICITPTTSCDVPPSPLYSSCVCRTGSGYESGQVLG